MTEQLELTTGEYAGGTWYAFVRPKGGGPRAFAGTFFSMGETEEEAANDALDVYEIWVEKERGDFGD